MKCESGKMKDENGKWKVEKFLTEGTDYTETKTNPFHLCNLWLKHIIRVHLRTSASNNLFEQNVPEVVVGENAYCNE